MKVQNPNKPKNLRRHSLNNKFLVNQKYQPKQSFLNHHLQ